MTTNVYARAKLRAQAAQKPAQAARPPYPLPHVRPITHKKPKHTRLKHPCHVTDHKRLLWSGTMATKHRAAQAGERGRTLCPPPKTSSLRAPATPALPRRRTGARWGGSAWSAPHKRSPAGKQESNHPQVAKSSVDTPTHTPTHPMPHRITRPTRPPVAAAVPLGTLWSLRARSGSWQHGWRPVKRLQS